MILTKGQTSVKLYISLTLAHSVDSAMYTLLHSHVKQFLSLLPKANSSEITVLLLTPQHSSTNPKKPRRLEPLGAPLLGPSAGNSPVAKNNSQTDDRLNLGGDHTVNVLSFFLKTFLEMAKIQAPVSQRITARLSNIGTTKPSKIQDNTSPSSNVNVGSLLSPYLKFKANI